MTAQTNAPARLLALAEQTEILVEMLAAVDPESPTLARIARVMLDAAEQLHTASTHAATIARQDAALDLAESLRRCTGATKVTVHDSGISATSTTDR